MTVREPDVQLLAPDVALLCPRPGDAPRMREVFAHTRALTQEMKRWFLIVDVQELQHPSAAALRKVIDELSHVDGLAHVATVVGTNVVLKVAARFVARSLGMKSFTVVSTREEAIRAVYSLR